MSSELAEKFLNEDYWDEDYPDEDYLNLNLDLPVPDWHLAILKERMERYRTADKTNWTTLEEFEKEIEQFMNSLKTEKD
jgi:hypothetical protein